jgi:hypothetical protein
MGHGGDSHLDDLAHERAIWKLQHYAWTFFALILVAALLGLFGDGVLSHAKAAKPGLSLEYERFGRYQAPNALKLRLGAGGGNTLPAVWLDRDFVDQIEIQEIYPPPELVKVTSDRLIYIFNVAQTNDTVAIAFHFKPDGYGKTRGRLGLVDGPELTFSQFIYP